MDQFLTYKKGNLGPAFNFTADVYIYICREREREIIGSYTLEKVLPDSS